MDRTEVLRKDIHRTGRDYVLSRAKTFPDNEARHIRNAIDLLTEQQPVNQWSATTKQSIKRTYGLCRFWDVIPADIIAMLLFDCYHRGVPESEFRSIFGEEAGHAYYTYIQSHCAHGEDREGDGEAIGKRYLSFMRDTGTMVALNDNQRRNAMVWHHILTEASDKMYRKVRDRVAVEYADDLDVLDRAYEVLKASCRTEISPSGESYVVHPLRIAAILANLGYGGQVVAASLLREPIRLEACTPDAIKAVCGSNVCGYVEATVCLDTLFSDIEERDGAAGESPEARFRNTVRFDEDMHAALSIRSADMLHSLILADEDPTGFEPELDSGYPVFEKMLREHGFVHILQLFENHAWRATDPKRYHRISTKYHSLYRDNRTHVEDFLAFVRGIFDEDFDREICRHGVGGYDVRIAERAYLPLEVYRLINPSGERLCDPEEMVSKHRMPLCDIDIVIMPNSPIGSAALFTTQLVHAFAQKGADAGMTLSRFYSDASRRLVLEMEDAFLNVFRCCIVEREMYRANRLGGLLYPDESATSCSARNARILVHIGSQSLLLPGGATVIDAAFKLSTEVGLSLTAARVNRRAVEVTAVLNDGDTLTLEADARLFNKPFVLHAQSDWLADVVTERARTGIANHLAPHR